MDVAFVDYIETYYSNKANILLGILIATVNLVVLVAYINLGLWRQFCYIPMSYTVLGMVVEQLFLMVQQLILMDKI